MSKQNDNREPESPAGFAPLGGSECPVCNEIWPTDCEQSVHAELYGYCIACGCSDNRSVYLNETVHEKVRRMEAKGEKHDYDLSKYPVTQNTVYTPDDSYNSNEPK